MRLTFAASLLLLLLPGHALAQPAATPAPATHAAPELGRLFFSPAERELLERDRGRAAETAPAAPQVVNINGIISLPGRRALPVVDGKVVLPGHDPAGLRISGRADGQVLVVQPDGTARLAKPGQSVDLATGEVREMYDLPGRREARTREVPLPVPFASGYAPAVEKSQATRITKAKRPRRAAARRATAPGQKPVQRKPAAMAPPAPPRNAPAPSIPAPLPRQP